MLFVGQVVVVKLIANFESVWPSGNTGRYNFLWEIAVTLEFAKNSKSQCLWLQQQRIFFVPFFVRLALGSPCKNRKMNCKAVSGLQDDFQVRRSKIAQVIRRRMKSLRRARRGRQDPRKIPSLLSTPSDASETVSTTTASSFTAGKVVLGDDEREGEGEVALASSLLDDPAAVAAATAVDLSPPPPHEGLSPRVVGRTVGVGVGADHHVLEVLRTEDGGGVGGVGGDGLGVAKEPGRDQGEGEEEEVTFGYVETGPPLPLPPPPATVVPPEPAPAPAVMKVEPRSQQQQQQQRQQVEEGQQESNGSPEEEGLHKKHRECLLVRECSTDDDDDQVEEDTTASVDRLLPLARVDRKTFSSLLGHVNKKKKKKKDEEEESGSPSLPREEEKVGPSISLFRGARRDFEHSKCCPNAPPSPPALRLQVRGRRGSCTSRHSPSAPLPLPLPPPPPPPTVRWSRREGDPHGLLTVDQGDAELVIRLAAAAAAAAAAAEGGANPSHSDAARDDGSVRLFALGLFFAVVLANLAVRVWWGNC